MSTTNTNILLVEDEESLHETLKLNLELEGYNVVSAYDGKQAINFIKQEYFDLIILDVMLPEYDGITITENTRLHKIQTPILILSAKNTGADRILGLKKGADDYLTKPFELEELLIRIQNLLQKSKQLLQINTTDEEVYTFSQNAIYFKQHQAINFKGEKIELSKREFMLLKLLIENEGEVVTREKILALIWGVNVYPTSRTIDNFILNLRKHFEPDSKNPKHFFSVRGLGYKFLA